MSGRTFIVKYFSKNRNWHSNKLPDHGHVNYTRTLLSKYFEAHIWKLLFNTVKIKINGTKLEPSWKGKTGRRGGRKGVCLVPLERLFMQTFNFAALCL